MKNESKVKKSQFFFFIEKGFGNGSLSFHMTFSTIVRENVKVFLRKSVLVPHLLIRKINFVITLTTVDSMSRKQNQSSRVYVL